jgi:hypothetical protein
MSDIFDLGDILIPQAHLGTIVYPRNIILGEIESSVAAHNVSLTDKKVASFKNIPSGWHYGEGVAPSSAMIDNARDWLNKIAEVGFTTTNAFPGVGGEIMVSGCNDDHNIEIVLEIDGTISFYEEKDDESVTSIDHGELTEVEEALARAAGNQWSISDFSINDILSRTKIDSFDWRFAITGAALPLFYMNVYRSPAPRSARTFSVIIPTLPDSLPSFGYWIGHQALVAPRSLLPPR